ncbi:MAG TPA: CmcJ/NvfI family oxidoreductase [Allosphingosinicella sp.]|jgi:hypothetical protein|nr:CmcJ/NvfI family oxidoreductase [Allosphingosinicella sp.]
METAARPRAIAAAARALLSRWLPSGGGKGDVEAELSYLASAERRPRVDREDPSRNVMPRIPVRMPIRDRRGSSPPPSLEREGFALLRRPSRVSDFASREQLDRIYRPEVEEIVKTLTGARAAFTNHHLIFRSERHGPDSSGSAADPPYRAVHSDFTPVSAPLSAAEELERFGLPADVPAHFGIFNVWRSLRPPPQDTPLALCDARSVRREDMIASDAVAICGTNQRSVEFVSYLHDPAHRWGYFSAMEPDEVIVFRQHDSRLPQPSGCAHSAFRHPAPGCVAAPRLSIEARVYAFFGD